MDTEKNTSGEKQPREPSCFEEWLFGRRKGQDEVGSVARWVLGRMKPGHPARWTPEPVLLARHGHAYDVPLRYEVYLRHAANQSEDAIEAFFRVYDLYLKDDGAAYDRMVEERGRELGAELEEGCSGGGGGTGDSGGTTTGAEDADEGSEGLDEWLSWNRFFNRALGPEQIGYDVDEDGWPIEEEPRDEGRE